MAPRTPPGFMPGDTAENDRNLLAALVGTPGIVGSADLLVTANGTPNMTVNVAAGAAFVKGTETTYQGVYHAFNDAVVNLAIAASDPTNPRIDIVVAQVRDAFYSGASNDFRLVVVTGTPAGSPAAPATPADSIVLARVAVAALVTSIIAGYITDKRTMMLTTRPSGPGAFPLQVQVGTLTGGAVAANLEADYTVTLPIAWPTAHLFFVATIVAPTSTWTDVLIRGCNPISLTQGGFHVANGATAQSIPGYNWLSVGY